MPKVSIIVPVYKVEKLLPRCVDSILAQTFTDFELLLIDDGSPDNSGKICDAYAEKDSRVKVFQKKNGGVSSARNVGLDHADGTYIMFCDSDDTVEPDWVETLFKIISQNYVALGIAGYFKVKGDTVSTRSLSTETVLPCSQFYSLCSSSLIPYVWNKIFIREKIDDIGLRFDTSMQYGEDCFFVFEYIKKYGGDFGICSECTYYYFDVSDSISHSYVPALWDCYEKIHSAREELFSLFGVDMEQNNKNYGAYLAWTCHSSMRNYLVYDNQLTGKEKLTHIKAIVNSSFFDKAIRYSGNGVQKTIFQTKNPRLIFLCYQFLKLFYYR